MILYHLVENKLKPEEHLHCARVNTVHNVGVDEFADFLIARGSSLTKTDTLGLIQMMEETIESLLSQSYSVSLPFATFSSGVKGNFTGPTDNFEESRHQVRALVRAGAKLKHFFTHGVKVAKETYDTTRPILKKYEDRASNTINSILTPGGIGRLYGKDMAFAEGDPDQGIFLTGQDANGASVQVKVQTLAEARPSFHAFVVPIDLGQGSYQIEVIAKYGEELREGVLNKTLTVG